MLYIIEVIYTIDMDQEMTMFSVFVEEEYRMISW